MKNFISVIIILIISVILQNRSLSQDEHSELGGLFKAGSKPKSYEIGADIKMYNDHTAYFIKSVENVTDGFGTIMKQILPSEYSGKRVRLTGYIKTEDALWAGMWMRVDGRDPGLMLGFDNMGDRPIKGTTDWQKYEIVLDVPDSSANIAYGVLLSGNGNVWLSDLSFEIVNTNVPSTNMLTPEQMQITTTYSELPPELKDTPDGIVVKHNPQTAYATINKKDTGMYYWFYETTVKPVSEDIEITEFGAYTWIVNHWEFGTVTGKPFEPKDFAEWYKCKKGKMKIGKEYTDKSNWNRWPSLQKAKILWYYLGKNSKGELVKGTAIVDNLPELKK